MNIARAILGQIGENWHTQLSFIAMDWKIPMQMEDMTRRCTLYIG